MVCSVSLGFRDPSSNPVTIHCLVCWDKLSRSVFLIMKNAYIHEPHAQHPTTPHHTTQHLRPKGSKESQLWVHLSKLRTLRKFYLFTSWRILFETIFSDSFPKCVLVKLCCFPWSHPWYQRWQLRMKVGGSKTCQGSCSVEVWSHHLMTWYN